MLKITENTIEGVGGDLQFFPSGTLYQPTSSAPATAAQFDIHIPPTVGGDWISNSELNPYIILPLISSSNTGINANRELVIRFFTSSHFSTSNQELFTANEGGRRTFSSSLYYTSSNDQSTPYRDILLTPTGSGIATATLLRDKIFDVITGSSFYNNGMISASKQGNFTSSVFLTNARGKVSQPTVYTGSLTTNTSFSVNVISTGSGLLNYSEPYVLSNDSASYVVGIDPTDKLSFSIAIGTSSLAHTGSQASQSIILYASGGIGGEGRVGFGTKNPKTKYDFKGDGFKIRSKDGKRELRFEEDGRLTAKKYADTATSESVGSEILLSYTPGTFKSPQKAQVGETIGTINYVDESFNETNLSDKYLKSGSVAQITSTVRKVTGLGAAGDLQFKVNVDPTAPQDTLVSFMDIDPFTYGAAVHFPYSVHSEANVSASGNIYGSRIYQNGTQIQTIYSPIAGGTGIETVGALNAGSITSGFTSIDVGSGAITTTGIVSTGTVNASSHITASGNISSSGTITAQSASIAGPIRGKQLQVYHANWKDDAGTTEIFIPLAGTPDEQTSGIKEQQAIIMPCSGTVKEIILRMHWTSTITTSDDITWKIYNRVPTKKMNGTTLLSSFTMTNPTQGTDDANNTRSSGTLNQAFAEGDALMISMQWASTGPTHTADRMYVTVVVENDWNTVGY